MERRKMRRVERRKGNVENRRRFDELPAEAASQRAN